MAFYVTGYESELISDLHCEEPLRNDHLLSFGVVLRKNISTMI